MKKNWYRGLTATAITLAMAGAAFTVPAMAIEYDLTNGDVFVSGNQSWQNDGTESGDFYYGYDAETDSWSNKTPGRYDHVANNDYSVDISADTTNPSGEGYGAVTVSGDLTGGDTDETNDVEVTISDVNVDTNETFLTVEDGTKGNITIEDSTIVAGNENGAAVEVNDGNVTIIDSNITASETADTGLTVNGGEVTIAGTGTTVVTGNGTGTELSGDAQLNVTDESTFVSIGETVSVSDDTVFDAATGIDVSGNASVNVDTDASMIAIGTDSSLSGYDNDMDLQISDSTGIQLSGNASFVTDGYVEVYGSQMYVGYNSSVLDIDGSTGLEVSDSATVTIEENGRIGAYDGIAYYGSAIYDDQTTSDNNDSAAIELNDNAKLDSAGKLEAQGNYAVKLNDKSTFHLDAGTFEAETTSTENAVVNMSENATIMLDTAADMTLTDYGAGGITVDESEKTGYIWVETDEPVSGALYNYHYIDITNKDNYNYYAYWIIPEDAEGNQTIDIYDIMSGIENLVVMPGSKITYKIDIINKSNHTYDYLDDSLYVSPRDNPENNPAFYPARIPSNQAIIDLYKEKGMSDKYPDFQQLANVEKVLMEQGYNGKIYTLEEYGSYEAIMEAFYVDYLNKKFPDSMLTSLEDAGLKELQLLFNKPGPNGIYSMSVETYNRYKEELEGSYILYICEGNPETDDFVKVQLKESNYDLGGSRYWYQYCLVLAFGESAVGELRKGENDNYYFAQYNSNGVKGPQWDIANQYFDSLFKNKLTGQSNLSFVAGFALDGPNTGNIAQNIDFWWENTITLDQLDGVLDLTKVDEEGNVITSDEATFQIWYDDEDGTRYYLTLGEDDLYKFVTEESTVDTVNGRLLVEYALLEGVDYLIKEVEAPDGYLLDDTVLGLTLENSETTFPLEITNVAEDEEEEEEIPETPENPDPPYIPDYNSPVVDIEDPDVPLVEEPEEPEQPTEEIDDEETPLTPSIPDEVVDEIIEEIEDEVTPLASVPQTGAEMPAATAALPAGVLTLAVSALVRRLKRKD